MKAKRQALLVELIQQGAVSSHDDAVDALSQHGFSTTQATVSRDLEEIGAAKVKTSAGDRYELVGPSPGFGISLQQVVKEYVLEIVPSGNMIVIKTPPGYASVVASALDRARVNGVLGTVAGDDTLFVCADEKTRGAGVAKYLERLTKNPKGREPLRVLSLKK